MKYFDKWAGNLILALNAFLLFLILAADKVELPLLLAWGGRLHPLLLHLPIGIFTFACLLWVIRKQMQSQQALQFSLVLSALSIPLTAITGFFISRDGGYDDALLLRHQWGAVVFGLLAWAIYAGIQSFPEKINWWNPLFALTFSGMLLTGHWGGQLTHGADFLSWPENSADTPATGSQTAMASGTFYAAKIQPIFEQKCITCHRKDKSKGGLVLEDISSALKGGKSGPAWIPGDIAGSILLQRIHLPVTDKKHMPPRGKNPLTPEEEVLLDTWINAGADPKLTMNAIGSAHPLYAFSGLDENKQSAEKVYSFKAASAADIASLNDAFCTVKPIAAGSPALEAAFFIQKAFDPQKVAALEKVKGQLVRLNLSKMPIMDKDLQALLPFGKLEVLILNYTAISDAGLSTLKKLPALKSLGLAGTKVTARSAAVLSSYPALKEVFLWNTQVTSQEVEQLQKKYPRIRWNYGFTPSPEDVLALSPPLFENGKPVLAALDSIYLKTAIPGAVIRYTLDGTIPDSANGKIYRSPILFSDIVTVKARAFKKGWLASETAEMTVYKQGKKPERVELRTAPNPEYAAKPDVLVNAELGNITQFRSGQWMGYKDRPMEAIFHFSPKNAPELRSVAVSYGVNVGSYIVPPVSMEIWGGNRQEDMQLLVNASFDAFTVQDLADQESRGKVLRFPKSAQYPMYKLVVRNVTRLPDFHPGKGTPGWFFIDEVFFN